MNNLKALILALILNGILLSASAMPFQKDTTLSALIARNNGTQKDKSAEKLYLQLDRTTYAAGDTLWFRAYLLDATFMRRSDRSNVVYVELSDENNFVQVRRQVLMSYGLGRGCIPLIKRDFADGGYTIRAYTQWQRNFDESLIFKKQFYVGPPDAGKWLVRMSSAMRDDNTAQLRLQLLDMDKKPVNTQKVLLGVRQDQSILRRDRPAVTDVLGNIDFAVNLRDNKSAAYASLRKGGYDDVNNPTYRFPVIYNRPERTDVQFMPEGGYLVNGINSIVGFKAVAEDGKGAEVKGSIISTTTGIEAATFTSLHKGIGSFSFTPNANESYKAIVTFPGGTKKEYPLPAIKATGTVLNISTATESGDFAVGISGTAEVNGRYYLMAQSRGMICFAATVVLTNGKTSLINAPKSAFASGIVKFTLLNPALQTLNERLIYNDNKDNLNITITPHKPSYTPQDSIALQIEVKDKEGKPVQGAFSLSVTNSIADIANPDNPNIISHTLLSSDIKGYVEQPDYYFAGNHEKELDNLLLTQGWTAHEQSPTFKYEAEPSITIKGKSTDALGKPIAGNNLQLTSLNPFFSIDTVSDTNGNFTFTHVPPSDSLMYVRAKNKRGKVVSYNIELNKREWPVFSPNRLQTPWFFNTDTIRLKQNDTLLRNEDSNLAGAGRLLNEATIKDKKIIKGSHNLNGPGEADQIIDEHDIAKEPPMTLLELLKLKVTGFRAVGLGLETQYFVGAEEIYSEWPLAKRLYGGFVFDGIAARSIYNEDPKYTPGLPNRANIYRLLTSLTSEDIKGIEVMSLKYASKYFLANIKIEALKNDRAPRGVQPYIEITTKEGSGPFFKKYPNFLPFKPVSMAIRKDFYKPRYTIKDAVVASFDNRATIHWEPGIVTDKDGKATVCFYAAGQAATYTVTTEGSDMVGSLGTNVSNITIK